MIGRIRRAAVGTVLLFAATALTLGGMVLARPTFFGLTFLWCAVQAFQKPGFLMKPGFWRAVDIIATNLALIVVLGESMLRLSAAVGGSSPILSDALIAHRLVPGRDYSAGLRGNRLGYPGPDWTLTKQPGIRRIAALGDSFAVGPTVPFVSNYLTLLESGLPSTEILNFGVAGTGPREYALILRHDVWKFQPDLVLVSIFVGNDITEELATPRQMDPRRSYLYLFLTRVYRLLREKGDGALFGQRDARATLQPKRAPSPFSRLTAGRMSPATFLEVEQRRLSVCGTDSLPTVEKKWQHALLHLERLIDDCHRHRVPLACVLIPDEFQVNAELLRDVLSAIAIEPDRVDLHLPQRRLLSFFAERDVPCLDLLPAFAGVRDAYTPRDTHWNEKGNRIAADAIGGWLSRTVSWPPPPVP
jgi:hypothetical protein